MLADFNFPAQQKIVNDDGSITWQTIYDVDQPLMMWKLVISALKHPDVPIGDTKRKNFLADEIANNETIEVTVDDLTMFKALSRSNLAFSPLVMDCLQVYLDTIVPFAK